MATLTAQILIGSSHPYHQGIEPTHFLFLSENSRPAWMLVPQNLFEEDKENMRKKGKVIWIPTVRHMLEDALLMIAIHVCRDRKAIELASRFCDTIESSRVELYSALDAPQRQQLYQTCREIDNFPKLVITVLRSSTLESQLSTLESYSMDVEVCKPVYSRHRSTWIGEVVTEGSL